MRASCFILPLLALVSSTTAITRYDLHSNGQGVDRLLKRGDDTTSDEIFLTVPIVFYGETYESIFVNTNGLLSFKTDIPAFLNMEFPLDYPVIAPLYSNIDTTKAGSIFYRETQDAFSIMKASEDIRKCFPRNYDFQPKSLFIATWNDVGYHPMGSDKTNTFQVVVMSNGTDSYVQFLYPEDGIRWIQAVTKIAGISDARAQTGFVAEDLRFFVLKDSGKDGIRNVVSLSNCEQAGKFMYHVGNVYENVEEPTVYASSNTVNEMPTSCSQGGSQQCHNFARCVDQQEGFCCVCSHGYYGNGKNCIKNDAPFRVNGEISGELNGELVDNVNLQAYVVVSDGRSYTALSHVPDRFGYDMQTLSVFGSVIGWLFAKPRDGARNGYQLTGGVFNHTTEILFLDSNEKVTIRQNFMGLDVFDQLKMTGEIKGSIPKIPYGNKLDSDDYEEQYSVSRPGLIWSQSTRTYKNRGLHSQYSVKIEQSIAYDACKYAPPEDLQLEPMTLKVAKNFIGYESKEHIIRFGMSNKIGPFGREDPCVRGRSTCGYESSCVVDGNSFRCVCNPGYEENYSEGKSICVDVDECSIEAHNCDQNAICINQEGSFTCHCNEGYSGDGISCLRIQVQSVCHPNQCGPNAQCYEIKGAPHCECDEGFTGDGYQCWRSDETGCDVLHNCSPYATCSGADQYGPNVCQCIPGYEGDGYKCVPYEPEAPYVSETEPPEVTVPSKTEDTESSTYLPDGYVINARCIFTTCVCPANYQRNGRLCYRREESTMPPTTETYEEDELSCNVVNRCHPYAQCLYEATTGKYQCKCTGGYEGDGLECTEVEQSCENIDICDDHASCTFDPASTKYVCVCNIGYHGDGHVCTSIECNSSSDCEKNAECKYTEQFYLSRRMCVCKEGFSKDQNEACVADTETCGGAVCSDHATCHWDEKYEVYYCQCDLGYEGDGIDHCAESEPGCDTLQDCDLNADCERDANDNKYNCICKYGYYGDGYTCSRQITCKNDPYLCAPEATCISSVSGFICECNSGFKGNGTYCKKVMKKENNFLLLNQGMATLRVPFEPSAQNMGRAIQITYYQMAIGLDIDCSADRVYWSDITNRVIKSSNYDGSDIESFLTQDIISPEGLSIDWVSRNIFWTDSRKDTVEVANIDTKVRKVLFDTDLVDPRGIAVHPYKGKIFWSDWNRKSPKIEWANMDGTERDIFLMGDFVTLPNSLAIDWDTDELCYADAGTKKIECVRIDTLERRTAVVNCSYPFGLAITPSHYYWTDWTTQKIERLEKSTNIRQAPINVPLSGTGNKLFGMAAVLESCRTISNLCEYDNGQCPKSHLCLLNGKGNKSCVCGKSFIGPQIC